MSRKKVILDEHALPIDQEVREILINALTIACPEGGDWKLRSTIELADITLRFVRTASGRIAEHEREREAVAERFSAMKRKPLALALSAAKREIRQLNRAHSVLVSGVTFHAEKIRRAVAR